MYQKLYSELNLNKETKPNSDKTNKKLNKGKKTKESD